MKTTKSVFVVFRVRKTKGELRTELQGIFDTEARARRACRRQQDYFTEMPFNTEEPARTVCHRTIAPNLGMQLRWVFGVPRWVKMRAKT